MQHIEMAVANCSSVKLFICSRLQLKNVLETSVPRHFWMEKNCSLFLLSLHIWTFSIGTGNVKTGTVLDIDVKNLGLISNPFCMGMMSSRGAVLFGSIDSHQDYTECLLKTPASVTTEASLHVFLCWHDSERTELLLLPHHSWNTSFQIEFNEIR